MSLTAVKPRSLVEQVTDQLAAYIRDRSSGEKQRLPAERRLAEQFGVGRGVVREAIKTLESQGLLSVRQGSGVVIGDKLHRPLTGSLELLVPDAERRLQELTEVRMALEPAVAAAAATRASTVQVEELRRVHEELADAADVPAAIAADLHFHRSLAAMSGNSMFGLILDSLADLSLASRERTISRVGKQVGLRHHATILRAVERGNAGAAERAMRFHIEEAGKDMRLQ
jgi:GntR family transcriptional repressor for pyruvate dehydrogenase complex